MLLDTQVQPARRMDPWKSFLKRSFLSGIILQLSFSCQSRFSVLLNPVHCAGGGVEVRIWPCRRCQLARRFLPGSVISKCRPPMQHFKRKLARWVALQREFTKENFPLDFLFSLYPCQDNSLPFDGSKVSIGVEKLRSIAYLGTFGGAQ